MLNPLTVCPLCRRQVVSHPLEARGHTVRHECGGCGVQFWWPSKRADAYWYGMSGSTTADWNDSLLRPGHQRFLKNHPLRSGSLLDIGCGHGLFLDQVRQHLALDVWGLDWDRGAVEFGRRMRKLNHLFDTSLEDFANTTGQTQFDGITLFEVLEHQEDPVAFLRQTLGLLKPQGLVAGSVPNRDRLVVGRREEWDYPPQHVLWFHARSLEQLLRAAGLQRIRIWTLVDARVLINQIMARWSFGLASHLVAMPPPGPSTAADLSYTEWQTLKGRTSPIGYRITTTLKTLMLSPVWLVALAGVGLRPSTRHVLYFEAYRPGDCGG